MAISADIKLNFQIIVWKMDVIQEFHDLVICPCLDPDLSELSSEKRLEGFPCIVCRVFLTPILDAIVIDPGILHYCEGNNHNLLPCVGDLSCYCIDCSLDFSTNSSNNVSAEMGFSSLHRFFCTS